MKICFQALGPLTPWPQIANYIKSVHHVYKLEMYCRNDQTIKLFKAVAQWAFLIVFIS